MLRIMFPVLVCLFLIATGSHAEVTYSELQHIYEKGQLEKDFSQDRYIVGIYEGIKATNLAALMQNKQPLFCKPVSLELNARDINSIIRDSHEAYDTNGTIPVSYLLFIGLVKTFPCL